MPEEVGTEATRSDAPSADDNLFGEAADDKTAAAVDGQDSDAENAPEQQAAGDAGEQVANGEAEQDPQGADDPEEAEEPQESADAGGEAASTDDLKVVVSIKGGRAVIGVQRPSADPHIETFDDLDETGLTREVPAVIDRARARWEDNSKHPAYARPVPVRSRSRRGQAAAQATTAEGEEAQQATLGLF